MYVCIFNDIFEIVWFYFNKWFDFLLKCLIFYFKLIIINYLIILEKMEELLCNKGKSVIYFV